MNIFRSAAAVVLAMAVAAHAEPAPATTPYIDRLVSEALSKHPKIEAARARTEAAFDAIASVRLWQDPELGLGLTAASSRMREDDGDIRLTVDQALPRPGLYRAEQRRMTAEQRRQNADRLVTASELGLAIAQTVIELALADDTLALQDQEIRWLETITATALERAKNPESTAIEPLRLESELAVRKQKLDAARRQRGQTARTLNLLLLRNPNAAWPALTLAENSKGLNATSLRAEMERNNPRLASLRHQIEAARAGTDEAREKTRPAFSGSIETNAWSGGEVRDAMFTLKWTLPWFNRRGYRADYSRSEHLRRAAENDAAAESRELYQRLTALVTEVENNTRLAETWRSEVLPKTSKTVESFQNAWVSSKATLTEVLESRRALIDAQQEQKRATAAAQAALQSIAAITGRLGNPNREKP